MARNEVPPGTRPPRTAVPDDEAIAIAALGFLAGDAERLAGFLALTGLAPETLRAAARAPGFLGAVLDYLVGNEALLLAFAANAQLRPEAIAAAGRRLGGGG